MTLLVVVASMKLPSVSNLREHWAARARRSKAQRQALARMWLTRPLLHRQQAKSHATLNMPLRVSLIRVAPRLLDTDNLAGALKAVRDEVAAQLGVSDAPSSCVTWSYGQKKPLLPNATPGVMVIIDAEDAARVANGLGAR